MNQSLHQKLTPPVEVETVQYPTGDDDVFNDEPESTPELSLLEKAEDDQGSPYNYNEYPQTYCHFLNSKLTSFQDLKSPWAPLLTGTVE